jgi:hypothetical protein
MYWRNVIKKLKNERKNSIYAILGVSTKMKTKLLAIALIASTLLSACSTPDKKSETKLALCFMATAGQDQARIKFDQPLAKSGAVTGILEYAFAQKDQSWGISLGKIQEMP